MRTAALLEALLFTRTGNARGTHEQKAIVRGLAAPGWRLASVFPLLSHTAWEDLEFFPTQLAFSVLLLDFGGRTFEVSFALLPM